MSKQYSIIMQKVTEGADVVDFGKFNAVCTKIEQPEFEIKDVAVRNWADEDGDDSYVPNVLRLKAFNVEIGVAMKSKDFDVMEKFDKMIAYLTGIEDGCSVMRVFVEYDHFGRVCRLTKIDSIVFSRETVEEYVEFKLHFRVDSPRVIVNASRNEKNEIVSLYEIGG